MGVQPRRREEGATLTIEPGVSVCMTEPSPIVLMHDVDTAHNCWGTLVRQSETICLLLDGGLAGWIHGECMVGPPLSSVFRKFLIWLVAIGLWPLSAAAGEPVPALELLERARPVCQERQVHFPPGTDHSALPMLAPALSNVTVYPIGFSAKGRLASLRFAWGDAADSDRGNWDIVVQDLIDDKVVERHRGTTEDSGHGLREAVGSQVADVVALLTKHDIAYPVIDGGMPPLFYGGDVLTVEVSSKTSVEHGPDWVIQLRSAQSGSKRIAEHFLPAVAESILLNPQEPRAAVVIRTVGNDHGVPVVNCFFIGAHLTSGFSKK